MVQDPQHQLRDSNGNILGTYWADQDSVYIEHPSGEQIELDSGGVIVDGVTIGSTDVTLDTTLTSSDVTANVIDTLLVDASSAPVTVTLPSPNVDTNVSVKKIDSSSNTVTIATPASETIDGQSDLSISAQYVSRTITSDSSNYFIL